MSRTKKQLQNEISCLKRKLKNSAESIMGTSKGKLKELIKTKNKAIHKLNATIERVNKEKLMLVNDNHAMAEKLRELRDYIKENDW